MAAQAASSDEISALCQLASVAGANSWLVKDGWATSPQNVTSSVCTWFGVYCDSSGRVIEVTLRRNNLGGDASGIDLSKLTSLTIFDISHNAVTGAIPQSWVTHPTLVSLRLSQNQLNRLPDWLQFNVSASLASVYLASNAFPCPLLPRGTTVPARVARVWSDMNSTHCVRTKTRSRQITMTLPAEPPVLNVVNVTDLTGLLLTTHLNGTDPNVQALFMSTLFTICQIDGALSKFATQIEILTLLSLSFSRSLVTLNFTAAASLFLRQDIASRFKIQHVSVARLFVVNTVVVTPSLQPPGTPSPPLTNEPAKEGISNGAIVAILVVGVVLVVVLFAAAAVCWCRRRRAFTTVEHMPSAFAMQQQQQQRTFVRSKSLRVGTTMKTHTAVTVPPQGQST